MTAKQRPIGSEKIRRAYAFLVEVERNGQIFTREDLVLASSWTDKTTRANLSKKLGRYVRLASIYRVRDDFDEKIERAGLSKAELARRAEVSKYTLQKETSGELPCARGASA